VIKRWGSRFTGRVARGAAPGWEQPVAERIKRGGARLSAHGHSSFQRRGPSHPQGFWPVFLGSGSRRFPDLFALHRRMPGSLEQAAQARSHVDVVGH